MTFIASKPHPWTGSRWYAAMWVVVAVVLVGAYVSEPSSLIRGFFALGAVVCLFAQLRALRDARLTDQ